MVERTQVAIVGAGPAGLLLGTLLSRHGIATVILEARSRDYCEARIRAGVLEQSTRDVLSQAGVGERMEREGLVHGGIHLRFAGQSHRIPMRELTGRSVTIYGQTEVTKDLIADRLGRRSPLRFGCQDVRVGELGGEAPRVSYCYGGHVRELRCEFIVGCDGSHGVCREAIPAGELRTWQRDYPFAWLGILADVPPSTDELIYARHEHGFALHSMRSRQLSRLYIQVDPGDRVEDWCDGRIWDELGTRLATDGWSLTEGPVLEKSITPMRSFVAAPMRYEGLFLAGDAAHIVPPTGAKGLNLAVSDVTVLAGALCEYFERGSRVALDGYSKRCLDRVWRAQHFASWMTKLLHVDPDEDEYGRRLQLAELDYLTRSDAAARSLAENYVGLPIDAVAISELSRA